MEDIGSKASTSDKCLFWEKYVANQEKQNTRHTPWPWPEVFDLRYEYVGGKITEKQDATHLFSKGSQ